MDKPTPVILKVSTPEFKKVVIEASDGKRYFSDLSSFSGVFCFPANSGDWNKVSIDSYGLGLIWASRFEVHVDQVIALVSKSEPVSISKSA